jgi:hypothetical protein
MITKEKINSACRTCSCGTPFHKMRKKNSQNKKYNIFLLTRSIEIRIKGTNIKVTDFINKKNAHNVM